MECRFDGIDHGSLVYLSMLPPQCDKNGVDAGLDSGGCLRSTGYQCV